MDDRKILIINLGSTSSKFGYAEGPKVLVTKEWDHSAELKTVAKEDQLAFRRKYADRFLEENGLSMKDMNAIAVRGMGADGTYSHGAYLLTREIADECRAGKVGHPGLSAGTIIGSELSEEYGIPAYLYDVVPTDEIYEIARVTGIKDYRRSAHSHTLNGRATAKKAAEMLGLDFNDSTFILCHMGGGTGTMCIVNGTIVDAYSAEEGSFSPIRPGLIPTPVLQKVYTDKDMPKEEKNRILKKDVGLMGHLGTGDCIEVERRIAAGDKKALLAYEAMGYQFSKNIGAMAAVAKGKVNAIILTGGIAHSKMMTDWIKDRVGFIAPVIVIPGSMEMEALAEGITRVMNGEEGLNDYSLTKVKHKLFED